MDLLLEDDLNLFEQIGTGNEEAFRHIFHLYNQKLHPFILKVTCSESVAEDIIQETFLRLWVHRQEVAEMEYPVSWLYKVASNLSLTHLRKLASENRRLQRMEAVESTARNEVIDNISVKEIQALLAKAVDQLPPRRQCIYKMSRDMGLSHKEIAEQLRISPNTVKNQLVSAFKFIKDYIRQTDDIVIPILILIFFHH